jgi:hypothetical protein
MLVRRVLTFIDLNRTNTLLPVAENNFRMVTEIDMLISIL